ncbi:AMP-binding protein [Rubrivirga marina]|uniref:AMP-dependent synthetase/ligase domain-containing protein n=1 Tax=Rubrivirga marina TaxID=1196024 RepID=A0A271J4D8_9BACT|nr:AMP-binding protein [Rubrivirga marina]PAP77815.1 hypothetical protein BSZ37_15880 [Rubrivirga marina]
MTTAARDGGTNVVERFQSQAEARPEAPAIVEGRGRHRRVTTFADLDRQAAAGAGRLTAAGVGRGDRVLVLVPVSSALYAVLAAVFRVGAVAVIVDPGAGRERLAEAVGRVRPQAFVGTPKAHLLRLLAASVRRIPTRFVVGGWAPLAERWEGGPPVPVADVGRDAPALLTFTSGTTGRPKAAVRTHGLLGAQHAALTDALDLQPDDVDLATLPVVVLATLASGVTTVLADADLRRPGAVDASRVLRQMRAEGVTRCVASPAFFERLLAHPEADALRQLRRVDTGGAPVFPDLLARLGALVGEAVGVYGSTEAEPIAHVAAPSEADLRRVAAGEGLPAGPPVAAVDLRIVPDRWGEPLGPFTEAEWEARSLGPGAVGEIVVAGDHVVPGYLDGEGDAETKVDVAGRRWHRTGDAGRLDADGRLWLLGRCAAVSRREGSVVYPLQVEAALRTRLDARAAFVEIDGQRVVAVEGAVPDGLAEAVPWAAIDAVVSVDALPVDRRHNAKVDLGALCKRLEGTIARAPA